MRRNTGETWWIVERYKDVMQGENGIGAYSRNAEFFFLYYTTLAESAKVPWFGILVSQVHLQFQILLKGK